MSISTPKNAISLLSNAIVLSGSARSGTTITGKILHSFHNVEYLYEPPIIFTLLALRNKIGEDEFKAIYGSYLYDEFFVNRDWPLASAVATILLLILVIPIMLFQRSQRDKPQS